MSVDRVGGAGIINDGSGGSQVEERAARSYGKIVW